MAKQKIKKSIISGSNLKSIQPNKIVVAVIVLIIALVGGFLVYRSFATSARRVYAAADSEIKAGVASTDQRIKDGAVTVINMAGKRTAVPDAPHTQDSILRVSVFGNKPQTVSNILWLNPGQAICAYVAVVGKNGQSVSAAEIAQADPGTESRLRTTYFVGYPEPPKSNAFNYTVGRQSVNISAHILGDDTNYQGVGSYKKYCWKNPSTTEKSRIGDMSFSVVTDKNFNSILDKGYSVRLLKVVVNDTAADEPFNKNPYR